VFNDIRPFQWEGFTYLVNYTYVKTLSDLNFEYNIRSREKKALESGISLSLSSSFVRIWQHQQMDLKRFNFPDLTLRKLQKMFNDWHKSGFLQIYEAVYKEAIIGSSCILIDKTSSTAYNLLISSENKNYRTGVHAA